MILSMTGYGKAQCHYNDKTLKIEIRSLNSKNFDLNLKIPCEFKQKESAIRNAAVRKLERGKVELVMAYDSSSKVPAYQVNRNLFLHYYKELSKLSDELNIQSPTGEIFSHVLKLPDMLLAPDEELNDQEWMNVEDAIDEAMDNLINFRRSEGVYLENDIHLHKNKIAELLQEIPQFEKSRIKLIRERLIKAFHDASEDVHADKNRFEQELIYYLEKYDITEEIVRLKKHLEYFSETMEDQQNTGKKLGFISQELGREINTIGSKAHSAEIQKIVVQMKDELEKIKEQMMNIL